jgi:hypothetical protein
MGSDESFYELKFFDDNFEEHYVAEKIFSDYSTFKF